jgi:iron complex outermembrane recepter protein
VQYSISGGVKVDISSYTTLELSGVFSRAVDRYNATQTYDYTDSSVPYFVDKEFYLSEFRNITENNGASAILRSSLSALGINSSFAVGVQYRHETLDSTTGSNYTTDPDTGNGPASINRVIAGRNVKSAFIEASLPVVGRASDGLLVLSGAARYDHYSDFGGTFNAQGGAILRPTRDFTFKGDYSSSFRAPDLLTLTAVPSGLIYNLVDPTSPSGTSPVLIAGGTQPRLGPERARAITLEGNFKPRALRWLSMSVSWTHVRYTGRISAPALGSDRLTPLANEAAYGQLITRAPNQSYINQFFAGSVRNFTGLPWDGSASTILAAFPNLVVFDNRTTNVATQRVDVLIAAEK